ncbi:MAG: alcohol dehydrogenase catalytic domain-containing protein [Acidobacteria bacterium]|nr:alcohol dehydrogenase catalytic domain-containing protein [Acidobacteriota bacterium]MCA1608340.1 alcohol dehydrogenase catalytic domain-containing protein [Acidobacteriota bacterium]
MKALRVENNRLVLKEVPIPEVPSEALIRVVKSGICGTDLQIINGYANFSGTIGHEFVGVVEAAPGRPEIIGRRVVGEINAGCGACDLCRAGDPRHCAQRTVLGIKNRDGAHAEFLSLPAAILFDVPDSVPDDSAVFVEPLAAALGITEQVEISSVTDVAVIGDGKLGLLCAFTLSLKSKGVVLIGKHREKLKLAENRGIETSDASSAARLRATFDIVVEASGSGTGFAAALDLVRPRGKIVLKSTFSGYPTLDAWRMVVDEITIVGSRCGRFQPAIDMLANGTINVSELISDEFKLESGIAAIRRAGEKGVLKVLLSPG